MQEVAYVIVAGMAGTMGLAMLNARRASPILAIFNRWLRWIVFSMALAYLAHAFGWSARPYWVLAVSMFLLWFLLETLYNWMAITILSRSDVPLFPRFSQNDTNQEWPVHPRIAAIRDWLVENGFGKVQSLQANIGMDLGIKSSVYDSKDRTIRAHIMFVPNRIGSVTVCCAFASRTEAGIRLVTDNLIMPFGGFYPENWRVVRKPLVRRFEKLLRIHRERMEAAGEPLKPFESEPVDELNHQQAVLERVNTEYGFLIPHHLREEHGKITREGRYRVWKEVWLLNYFGATNRY